MLKESARKPSQDPNRESLLKKKDELKSNISTFNSKVKSLKKNLHEFKKVMQTSLNNPIPETSAAYLSKLTSEFNEIANLFSQIPAKSSQIIQQQAALPKPMQAKASTESGLVVTASSRVSRLLTRLKNLSSDDPESADRMSLLIICEELYYDLEKFQAHVVSTESSPQSIYSADALMNKIHTNIKLIGGVVSRYSREKIREEGSLKDLKKPEQPEEDKKSDVQDLCDKMILKYNQNKNKYSDQDREELELLVFKYNGKPSDENAAAVIEKIRSMKFVPKDEGQIEKSAQVTLKKWLGKAKHSLTQYLADKTSNFRLRAYNIAEEMRANLDELMGSLESGLNISEVADKEKKLLSDYEKVKSEVLLLRSVLTGVAVDDDFIKLLREKEFTDFDVKMTPKQEEQLKQLMERRRMRDIANISKYRR